MQLVDPNKLNIIAKVIAGSGLIVDRYLASKPLDNIGNTIKIVLMPRLLWTKGVLECVQAAGHINSYIKN